MSKKIDSKQIICPYRKKCGGCQLWNMSYEEQLSFKQVKVIKLLGKFHHVSEIIGMDEPYHYRNKVQAAFGTARNGRIISGIFQSASHRIVPVSQCLTEDKKADEIISSVRELLPSFKLSAYNEDTHRGFLRHVLVKRGFKSGEIMVVLVGGTNVFPKKKDFVKALLKRHPEITTVVFNVNDRKTSLVLGERQEVLYGTGKITEQLLGCKFRISPKSFYQINPTQTEVLYTKALEMADLKKTDELLDAYCGIGTIGLIAAGRVKTVIGVELNKDAIKDARENAKLNGIKNAEFYLADAGEFMLNRKAQGKRANVVIMDPPRAGASKQFLSCLVSAEPERIVYISCNPETQKRDLFYLVKNGYKVKKIQPVDMFPHTEHIETVVLLQKILDK